MTRAASASPSATPTARSGRPAGASPWLRRALERRLAALTTGRLTLVEAGNDGGPSRTFGAADADLHATVTVHDPAFYRRAVTGGSLGVAEAFIDGQWDTDDLTALLRIFVRDTTTTDDLERGRGVRQVARRIGHALRRNSKRGSQTNIAAHYDLGNELFDLMLDETLTYSCGIFERPDATLAEASTAKLDRLCRKLDLRPEDHLLEIGTGWGSLALHAAGRYGCRVTTTTISAAQHERAAARIRAAGLAERVTLLQTDYRELEGTYDKLVSIEMIEAVGHRFLPEYFGVIARRLRPDGLAAVQAITMPDHRYEQYRHDVDFIQKYIFPGSCCPSVAAMTSAVARGSDLRLVDLEEIGPHYATTLARWRDNFTARLDDVRALGGTEAFIRTWLYYLAYCEAGFVERYIGDVHLVLAKPQARPVMPSLAPIPAPPAR